MTRRLRAFLALFAIGAVGLTLLDSVHVHTGTLYYDHPFAYGSAWWVPLLMGSAASCGGMLYVEILLRGEPGILQRLQLRLQAEALLDLRHGHRAGGLRLGRARRDQRRETEHGKAEFGLEENHRLLRAYSTVPDYGKLVNASTACWFPATAQPLNPVIEPCM